MVKNILLSRRKSFRLKKPLSPSQTTSKNCSFSFLAEVLRSFSEIGPKHLMQPADFSARKRKCVRTAPVRGGGGGQGGSGGGELEVEVGILDAWGRGIASQKTKVRKPVKKGTKKRLKKLACCRFCSKKPTEPLTKIGVKKDGC